MHPDFGVGARNYLFDTKAETYQNLKNVINIQVRRFIPFIKIINIGLFDVNLDEAQTNNYLETQYLGLKITYYIPNLNLNDTLKVTIANSV